MKDYVALKVSCPLSHHDETVYVYYADLSDIHTKLFTGCENSTGAEVCSTVCKVKAFNLCRDYRPGELQVRPHIPVPPLDDLGE